MHSYRAKKATSNTSLGPAMNIKVVFENFRIPPFSNLGLRSNISL